MNFCSLSRSRLAGRNGEKPAMQSKRLAKLSVAPYALAGLLAIGLDQIIDATVQ